MKITKTDSKLVSQIVEAASIYSPSADQRRVKADFQSALIDGPAPKKITAAFVVQLTGQSVVEKWWKIDGFRDWFLDPRSFDNAAEAYAGAALEIIANEMFTAEKSKDRQSAAKLMVEIAGKIKKNKVEVKFLDESLPDDAAGLDEYIARAGGNIANNASRDD